MSRARQEEPAVSADFLLLVYSLVSRGQIDAGMDELFGRLDDLFLDGDFAAADSLLQIVDLERLDTNLLVGLLCICSPAKRNLPHYDELLLRVRSRLSLTEPDRVDRLMSGFS